MSEASEEPKRTEPGEAVRQAVELLRQAGIKAEVVRLYGAGGDMIYLGGYQIGRK